MTPNRRPSDVTLSVLILALFVVGGFATWVVYG